MSALRKELIKLLGKAGFDCVCDNPDKPREWFYRQGAYWARDYYEKRIEGLAEALETIEGAFDNGKVRRQLKEVFSGKCEDVCQPCAQKKAREALRAYRDGDEGEK